LLSEVVSEKPLKTFERRHLEFYRKLVCLIVSEPGHISDTASHGMLARIPGRLPEQVQTISHGSPADDSKTI